MKKIIIVLLGIVFLLGCENKSKIEFIPNYEAKYYSFEMVESIAEPLQQNHPQPISFEKYIKEIHQREDPNENVYYPVSVRFFINEEGRIDKIAIINGSIALQIMRKMKKNGTISFEMERIIKMALSDLEKLKFKPAILSGKNVMVRADVQKIYLAKANGEVEIAENEIKFAKQKSDFETGHTKKEIYFVMVEKMPEPIGGIGAIQKNIKYPEIAKRAGVEGRVFVKAYIDEDGTVAKTQLIRGIGSGCDEVAMEAVKKVKFTPGTQRGKRVKVQLTVPILFKLDDTTNNRKKSKSHEKLRVMEMPSHHNGLSILQGKLVSEKNGDAIVGANVLLDGTKLGAASSDLGTFIINKIPPGEYTIIVSSPNYGKQKIGKVTLKEDINSLVSIELTKK